MLRVKLVRSPIGHTARNRATVAALGLRKVHQTVELPDNDSVRGMIFRVKHMLAVEEVESSSNGRMKSAPRRAKTGEGTKGAMRKAVRKTKRKAKVAAKPAPKPKAPKASKPKTAKPKAKAQAEKPKAAAKTKPESKPKTEAKAKPKPAGKSKAETKPKPRSAKPKK